jgi:hypothetical protein
MGEANSSKRIGQNHRDRLHKQMTRAGPLAQGPPSGVRERREILCTCSLKKERVGPMEPTWEEGLEKRVFCSPIFLSLSWGPCPFHGFKCHSRLMIPQSLLLDSSHLPQIPGTHSSFPLDVSIWLPHKHLKLNFKSELIPTNSYKYILLSESLVLLNASSFSHSHIKSNRKSYWLKLHMGWETLWPSPWPLHTCCSLLPASPASFSALLNLCFIHFEVTVTLGFQLFHVVLSVQWFHCSSKVLSTLSKALHPAMILPQVLCCIILPFTFYPPAPLILFSFL